MKFGSICSGIEAASEAWNPLGWKAQWFSEIEPFPSAVLAYRHPTVPNLGDMTKIYDKQEFIGREVDLICGGTPCQAFSVAGRRKGLADTRGNLSLEFCNIVHAKKPKWVVWENVPGVLSSKDNAFGCFLAGLAGADTPLLPGTGGGKWASAGIVSAAKADGYGIAWRILDAQYFGVPQRRRRVWVVGYLGGWRPAVEVLFERKSVSGDTAPGGKAGTTVAALTAAGVGTCGADDNQAQAGHIVSRMVAFGEYPQDGTFSTVKTRDYKDATDLVTQYGPIAGALTARHDSSPCADRGQNIVFGGAQVLPPVVSNGDAHSGFRDEAGLVYNVGHATEGVGCLSGDHECRASDTGHVVVSTGVRRLTPDECAKLQGFKPGHARIPWRGKPEEECPDGPQYKAYGNSWAVPCAAWIGLRITKYEYGVLI